jgi:RimJ/RimL family protein N-acetyltransferase
VRYALDFPYETPRLRLLPVEDRHADLIWEWSRDPRFNQHVLWTQPKIPLQAKRFIDSARAAWDAGLGFSYFAESKQTGETLARVEARRSRRRDGIAEVGMLIAPKAWNDRLATELTYFGLWFCFENMEREAVAIDAAPENGASNHLLENNLHLHPLKAQNFPLAEGGYARLNRFVMTRDEFQVRLLPEMKNYLLPTEADAEAQPTSATRGVDSIIEIPMVDRAALKSEPL